MIGNTQTFILHKQFLTAEQLSHSLSHYIVVGTNSLKTAARKMYSTHKMPRLIATDESDFI
jgi:hypothetical protein